MRLLWQKHGITMNGIAEDGMDDLLYELLGDGFTRTWKEMKSKYVYGTEDIPIQKWIGSKLISVKPKSESKLEKLKLQFGMRYSDSNGWLKVTHVLDGGVAQAVGLASGDLLASINGQRITSSRWDKVLGGVAEGQSIHVCFYRDDFMHERLAEVKAATPAQYELSTTKH
jgi:predicted metalloprotease with PDZ domain